MMKFLRVVKPASRMLPAVLEEMGYGDLVIPEKWEVSAGVPQDLHWRCYHE